MITKAKKEELFNEYSEIFQKSPIGILLEVKGLTVSELTELRLRLHQDGSVLKIVKNRIAKKASEGTPYEALNDNLNMVRALVYNYDNPVLPAKALLDASKKNNKISLVGGVFVDSNKTEILDADMIKELGSLPSREELLAKVLFLLNAPITNFARTLNQIPASFVRVLQAVADSKK